MKKKRDSRRLADSRVICRATCFWFPYPFHNDVFSRKQKKEDPKKTTVVLLSNPIGSGIVSSYNNNSSSSHCPRSRRMTAYSFGLLSTRRRPHSNKPDTDRERCTISSRLWKLFVLLVFLFSLQHFRMFNLFLFRDFLTRRRRRANKHGATSNLLFTRGNTSGQMQVKSPTRTWMTKKDHRALSVWKIQRKIKIPRTDGWEIRRWKRRKR
jgi:hypothetical protein